MTIIKAVIEVLKSENKALSAEEIFEKITTKNLFVFKAKEPISILKSQLRKNTAGYSGKNAIKPAVLKQDTNKRYLLI